MHNRDRLKVIEVKKQKKKQRILTEKQHDTNVISTIL